MSKNPIVSYYPLVFHVVIIVLLLVSCLSIKVLNSENIHALVADGVFQFWITIIILIVSFINPFLPMSPGTKLKFEEFKAEKGSDFLDWFLYGKNWQYAKLLTCIAVTASFILNGTLVFPDLNQGVISGVFVVLIAFFIFGCIIQLIRNPVLFRRQTIFRLSTLYRSFKTSFFISLCVCLAVFLLSTILNLKVSQVINYEAIVLLIYNIVMAFNEYKIIKSLKASDTSLAL